MLNLKKRLVPEVGDLIQDPASGEVGLLVERYVALDSSDTEDEIIWGWKVSWAGQKPSQSNRLDSITEFGLISLLEQEKFILIKARE
tara:strand:+ start:11512 stop:11772 length:261 start_codon:yes stop_codon:yes gene_type:complete